MTFNAKRWSQTDRIVGVATIVLFISLFLPWYGVNFGVGSVSVDGLWHGYMYITLILCLAVEAYLFARAAWAELPVQLPMAHERLLSIATGISFVITLIAFVAKPGGSAVGWRFGAFVGLISAFLALVPKVIPMVQAKWANRATTR